ncbi:MAG: amidohydrolase family protein [Thermodesulfobacteriota bacterium]|nr:amidohydrolase family protein [Thermodesulfobacteriota bacterium]
MFDFNSISVIDNHCHTYEPEKASLSPEGLAREFFHGMADIPDPNVKKPRHWGATDDLRYHFPNMGVVQTMVSLLSKVLGCPAELEAVASERNRRTSESFAAYAQLLYQNAGIVATVIDSGLPKNDPLLDLHPGKKLRLFQMGPAIEKLLKESNSYQELLRAYQESLEKAIRQDGFVGVKSHLAEEVGFGAEPVSRTDAENIFPAAKTGDPEAYKRLYVAIFMATLIQCQELGVPVHLHSGFTGGLWEGPLSNADPFLLVPMLRRHEFLKTKIVLLHAGYPWTKQAGQMAHAFPHVWVDMSQITPWGSLRIVECYRDVMAWAPLSKLMIGSGGHGTPEIAWLAARTAKIALAEVIGDAVKLGLMVPDQAERVARMILHDNAARLYGLE